MDLLEDLICQIGSLKVEDEKEKNSIDLTELMRKWECHKCKNCIKLIPFEKELTFKDFNLHERFKKVGTIVPDNELNTKGNKKRNTVIRFVPEEDIEWKKTNEWVYLFTINDQIVKIGGTRKSLKDRASSYLCGHHITERGRSNKCSVTNAYVYNTFDFYLQNGYEIEMYGYLIPECVVTLDIFDEEVDVRAQVYHAYEAKCLQEYKKQNGRFPHLSDNADPNYK